MFSEGWLTLDMQLKNSKNKSTTINLYAESPIVQKITYKRLDYAEKLVLELFSLSSDPNSGKPGNIFSYDSSVNYNAMIEKIQNPDKKTAIRKAFSDFQNYVNTTIEFVCADGAQFYAQINPQINNPYTAATRDLYMHIRKLGGALGVTFPDLDATWGRCFRRSLPWVVFVAGVGLAVYNWNQLPSLSRVGCAIESSGAAIKKAGYWLNPTTKPPLSVPAVSETTIMPTVAPVTSVVPSVPTP